MQDRFGCEGGSRLGAAAALRCAHRAWQVRAARNPRACRVGCARSRAPHGSLPPTPWSPPAEHPRQAPSATSDFTICRISTRAKRSIRTFDSDGVRGRFAFAAFTTRGFSPSRLSQPSTYFRLVSAEAMIRRLESTNAGVWPPAFASREFAVSIAARESCRCGSGRRDRRDRNRSRSLRAGPTSRFRPNTCAACPRPWSR